MKRIAVFFALLVAVLSAHGPSAWAHADLTASTPADGETVEADISRIALEFSQDVRVTLVQVVPAGSSQPVDLKSELPGAFSDAIAVSVPALATGAYKVRWTAIAKDGHVMDGGFSFTVADGNGAG